MDKPIISIIIPVYNVEKYLQQCIESVLDQVTDQVEIIMVDDGSTDKSASICKYYEEKYSYIKLISQDNAGLSAARNTGIRAAGGEYIVLLDSDDYLQAGAIQNIRHCIEEYHPDIIFGKLSMFDNQTKKVTEVKFDYSIAEGVIKAADVFYALGEKPSFWFAGVLLIAKRKVILDNGLLFQEGLLHEDELWVPMMFLTAQTAVTMDKPFYMYRINRSGSIVSSLNIKREFDKLLIAEKLDKYVCDGISEKEIIKRSKASLCFNVLLKMSNYRHVPGYKELCCKLRDDLSFLKYKKYTIICLMCLCFGVGITSCLLSKAFPN